MCIESKVNLGLGTSYILIWQLRDLLTTSQFTMAQQHPVSWQVTADGTRMIGNVILQKSYEGEEIISVSGGRLFANGSRGALVDAVKRGSLADLEGNILPGEYPFWCGSSVGGNLSLFGICLG